MICFKTFIKQLVLFIVFGSIYLGIEILYSGSSHWSSFIMGGLGGMIVGKLNEFYTFKMPVWIQLAISTIILTIIELIGGLIVNKLLRLNVWDYSDKPFNFYGQICLEFSFYWMLLSILIIYLDDWLRYKLFGERSPGKFTSYLIRIITLR